ncbi:MAG: glycerol-3-phosphate 1-O-acyltransferase PlsY [bacterium]|nr:glycerol-3-phosphate 1-O-acyltransferase PlsY [bacterium]
MIALFLQDDRPLPLWLAIVVAYLLGALPFGFLLAKILKGVDLREIGSGNIGATNTMRALGRGPGLLAFALDFLKGWLPTAVLAGLTVGEERLELAQVACGTAAVVGHCFPVYLGFKGGKGVATGCGAIVGIDPFVFLGAGVVWILTMLLTRYVSLASILMGLAFPVLFLVRYPGHIELLVGAGLLTFLIVVRHRANISRLLAGTEPRAGRKTSQPTHD